MKIYLYDSATGRIIKTWSAYKCLVAEVVYHAKTYILSLGQWKQVSQGLKEEVEDYIAGVPVVAPAYLINRLSIWDPESEENREAVFNAQVSAASQDIYLFDTAKIQIAGEKHYEVCDLLHKDKAFIQVKRFRSGAASISHLFLQGRFYADALLSDPQCRESMCAHIDANPNGKIPGIFKAVLPIDRASFIANNYTIIFCILSERPAFNLSNLPFMAQYELMHSHKYLSNALGFKCEVACPQIILGP